MELQCLGIVLQVEVSISQLAVDGAEHLQVLRAHLDGRLEEGDTGEIVSQLAEALPLQGQF